MDMTPSEAALVAEAVKWRRSDSGRSQLAVGNLGGTSDQTVMNLEKGEQLSYRDRSIAAVERGLEWPVGAIKQIITGADYRAIPHEPVVGMPEVKDPDTDEDIDVAAELGAIYVRIHHIREVAKSRTDIGDAQRHLASYTVGELEQILAELGHLWSDLGTERLAAGEGQQPITDLS